MPISSTDADGATRVRGRGEAHDPVLASEVTTPDLPGWAVTRPRIDTLIAEGARGPLTSVTGPPGAGKTMAIAAWAASTGYPCTLAWLNIDDYDNRPRVFWAYVVTALRRAGVAVPRVVPGPDRVGVDHMFLVRLASVLAAQDPPVVLVLDDLHLLTAPGILEGLGYVLRNARPGLHLIVASRADPLLPLHRYRLAGQLVEIRADDLAFSVQESGLLLAHHGVTLPSSVLERVTGRTEGWAAGMRLAALSLQGCPDPEQFGKEGRGQRHHRRDVPLGKHRQGSPQEHLPQAVGVSSQRGGPPRAATRADLTNLVFHPSRVGRGDAPVAGLSPDVVGPFRKRERHHV